MRMQERLLHWFWAAAEGPSPARTSGGGRGGSSGIMTLVMLSTDLCYRIWLTACPMSLPLPSMRIERSATTTRSGKREVIKWSKSCWKLQLQWQVCVLCVETHDLAFQLDHTMSTCVCHALVESVDSKLGYEDENPEFNHVGVINIDAHEITPFSEGFPRVIFFFVVLSYVIRSIVGLCREHWPPV